MPPLFLQSFVGTLACEIGFFAGAIFLALIGTPDSGGDFVSRPGLMLAIMAGVTYLELGAPMGALVQGHPFSKMERPNAGPSMISFWLKRTSRHGYRMGVFFASLLPVLAGVRVQFPGLPGWLGAILAFVWLASVIWGLRGKSLFPGHQPLLSLTAASLSLYIAGTTGDVFLQALSFLILIISSLAMLLNIPQLLPLRTFASGAYFLAVLTLLNSSHHLSLVFLLLTAAGGIAASLSRRRALSSLKAPLQG